MTLNKNSVAVVTGAASGIGRALAVRLSQEKITGIAISDVDREGLAETAKMVSIPCSTHIVDVSELDQVHQFAAEVLTRFGRATHLINNAGVGLFGSFEEISVEDFEWLMSINFWGVVYGCKAFLPILKQQEVAHIVNISSVFGMIAPPEQSHYCASKFAVRGFTEALRHEYEGTNIRVSSVHPGGIKTNIARNSRIGENTPKGNKQEGVNFFDKVARTSPEAAADAIVKGIRKENVRILIGKDAYAISFIHRLFPKKYLRIFEKIVGHRMDLRKTNK